MKIELRLIPPLTIDEEAYLMRERGWTEWKRMTRQEIDEKYPGVLGSKEVINKDAIDRS